MSAVRPNETSTLVIQCNTLGVVFETADWTHRAEYIVAKHQVFSAWADEAIADPDRVVINPDPASTSGRSVRIIGYSITAQAVLTVIVLDNEGTTFGVNAWKASARDRRLYRGD